MKIGIYYGGRGIIDDPTIAVLAKVQEVLEDLRVQVERYNLYENKNIIPSLPQTLKGLDGVILATTVEWYGIGGNLQQFLDACWQFGDKEKISNLYMMPVVMSRTYGEREARMDISVAWEILGGHSCEGICGYIDNTLDLEMNSAYEAIISRNVENFYRAINQKYASFPVSEVTLRQKVTLPHNVTLSQQETEQLSNLVSDETYVQTQKADIQELTDFFKGKLISAAQANEDEFVAEIKAAFKPAAGVAGSFSINIEEKAQNLTIVIAGPTISCGYGTLEKPDIEMEMKRDIMNEIVEGRMTFQRAFMSGAMTRMKGDFRIMNGLDQVLLFGNK